MSNKKNNPINDQNFDDEIFVALFRKGAHDYIENDLLINLPEEKKDTEPGLSALTKKKIEKMIRQAICRERSMRIVKHLPRIAAIALIVIALCAITVMSVEALRIPFLNLFINTKDNITVIDVGEEQLSSDNFGELFGYIPEGYELTSENNLEQGMAFIFTSGSKEDILIERYIEEGSLGIDTEAAEFAEVMINENNQGFYSTKNEEISLIFTKDGYTYFISANMDLSEIIKIAEKIK